jgi:hypothetical protein
MTAINITILIVYTWSFKDWQIEDGDFKFGDLLSTWQEISQSLICDIFIYWKVFWGPLIMFLFVFLYVASKILMIHFIYRFNLPTTNNTIWMVAPSLFLTYWINNGNLIFQEAVQVEETVKEAVQALDPTVQVGNHFGCYIKSNISLTILRYFSRLHLNQ